MEKKIITTLFEYPIDSNEISAEDKNLISEAIEITKNAYSPYSNFSVGAALLLENGEIITGTNQENAAYPSGLCAERVALFYANSRFPNAAVKTLAVVAKTPQSIVEEPVPPCGACRQVMVETEMRFKKPMKIILIGKNSIQIMENAKQLLPLSFDKEMLT